MRERLQLPIPMWRVQYQLLGGHRRGESLQFERGGLPLGRGPAPHEGRPDGAPQPLERRVEPDADLVHRERHPDQQQQRERGPAIESEDLCVAAT